MKLPDNETVKSLTKRFNNLYTRGQIMAKFWLYNKTESKKYSESTNLTEKQKSIMKTAINAERNLIGLCVTEIVYTLNISLKKR